MKYIAGIAAGLAIAGVTYACIVSIIFLGFPGFPIDLIYGKGADPVNIIFSSLFFGIPIALLVGILGGVVVSVMIAMLDKMDKR